MDSNQPRGTNQNSPSWKLSNGYVLPEGKITPNALFVGGIDFNVDESEIMDYFGRYGSIKEVKIFTYRGGVRKGYGFVYFNEDVNIQPIIEQQVSLKGRKIKLGPAILKERVSRSMPTYLNGPNSWVNPVKYVVTYCHRCQPVGVGVTQPLPIPNGGTTYSQVHSQPYVYNNYEGSMVPQNQMIYLQNPYDYQYNPTPWIPYQRTQPINQNFVDNGVQTPDGAVVYSY